MPTKKIADLTPHKVCKHPDHNPPMMRLFKPGIYEHTCPKCGNVIRFTVRQKDTLETQFEGDILQPKIDWTRRFGPGGVPLWQVFNMI